MAGASVLYINDKIVSPHLELLRRVCDPLSLSRPHITVRYSKRLGVPFEYLDLAVREIDLTEPGSFGLDLEAKDARRTIFIGCRSDYLKHWEFKPDFTTSEFHVTIYNGRSIDFAAKLLKLLRKYRWNFRVPLPAGTQLTEVPFEKNPRPTSQPRFSQNSKALFKQIFKSKVSRKILEQIDDSERLELARKICEHLQKATERFDRRKIRPTADWAKSSALDSFNSSTIPHVKTGIHITPPELALEITKYVMSLRKPHEGAIRFGDPAVGTGAFYSALLKLVTKSEIANAMGIDIDKEQVLAAHHRWSRDRLLVKHGDYLHMDDLPARNLILANPPYLRNQDIPPTYKKNLWARASTITGMKIRGTAGLYVYFLLLSHSWMDVGALAAWLIPATFLDTDYGEVIRYYLTNKVHLIRVHRYDYQERKFENALVNTAVVVFRNEAPSAGSTALLSLGGTLDAPTESNRVKISTLRPENRWTLRPPHIENEFSNVCLGDLFIVKRGIATGANEFFIMPSIEAERRAIPALFLQPILPKVRTLNSDIIERDWDGYPKIENKLSVINCSLAEDELEKKYKTFFAYLKSAGPEILQRNLVRRRTPWYKQEQRQPAPFLCTYMGRNTGDSPPVKFLWNKSDAIATNNYIMLYPRPRLAAALKERPKRLLELFRLLQRLPAETMADSWRVLAEGLHKIEPKALTEVKLPEEPQWLLNARDPDMFS